MGKAFGINRYTTDRENLQQMQIYFGVDSVTASLNDLMRVGNDKTNKLYSGRI